MLSSSTPDRRRHQDFVQRGTMAVVLVLSFPWGTFDLVGIVAALVWSGLASMLLAFEFGSGLLLTATSGASMMLAFSQGLGEAVAEGTTIEGTTASSEGALDAVMSLAVFLIVVAMMSTFVRRAVRVVSPPRPGLAAERKDVDLAMIAFVILCFASALATGTWTSWGGATQTEEGGFRLELFYPSGLLALWAYGTLGWLDGTLRPRLTEISGIVALIISLLMFGLQSRRLMIAAAILVAFAFVMSTSRLVMGRLTFQLGALVVVVTVFTLGSSGWRNVTSDESPAVADRIERAFEAVGDAKSFESFGSRLTYLWFDSTVHDLTRTQGADVDGGDVFLSTLAAAIPRALFPSKSAVEVVSCESGLEGFSGMAGDLPCTPTGEGQLMAGLLGVLLAGLLWGAALGIADACIERGPGLARVFGLFMFFPFVLVEAGVFAIVPSFRLGIIAAVLVALLAALARLIRGGKRQRGGVAGHETGR